MVVVEKRDVRGIWVATRYRQDDQLEVFQSVPEFFKLFQGGFRKFIIKKSEHITKVTYFYKKMY